MRGGQSSTLCNRINPGDKVLVNMTGLKSWEEYSYCYLKGTVKKATITWISVVLDRLDEFGVIKFHYKRIRCPPRPSKRNEKWTKGERVLVHWARHDLKTWCVATVQSDSSFNDLLRIKWVGNYKDHNTHVEYVKLSNVVSLI